MTHPNKKETPAEDDKKVIAETIEKRLKEAREAVLNTFKAKKKGRRAICVFWPQRQSSLG